MRGVVGVAQAVVRIAGRGLLTSRLKTLTVGSIIFFAAFLVVTGNALFDSVSTSLERSITGSLVGHLQVYNKESTDRLEVIGRTGIDDPDLEVLADYAAVKREIERIPNVRAIAPMAFAKATILAGNTIDRALERLRDAVEQVSTARDAEGTRAAEQELVAAKDHVRQIVKVLREDLLSLSAIANQSALRPEDLQAVERAAGDSLWTAFDADPLPVLEFLENNIAPIAVDPNIVQLSCVGTDPAAFTAAFDRLRVVDGKMIPSGRRGILLSKTVYEQEFKLKSARRLDEIREAIELHRKTIAGDAELQTLVRRNVEQVQDVLLQLDARRSGALGEKLRRELKSEASSLSELLASYFEVDDANFARRYEVFYDELAPELELYRVRVGDVLTLRRFDSNGYSHSVNVEVFGTFEFDGLQGAGLAGRENLMDLVSFRDLYGMMTPERQSEIRRLTTAAAVESVDRSTVEAALFSHEPDLGAEDASGADGQPAGDSAAATAALPPLESLEQDIGRERRAMTSSYEPSAVQSGDVMSLAVVLKDGERLSETIAAIESRGAALGLPLRAIPWQQASGMVGTIAMVCAAVLHIGVLLAFLVAMIVINNALVMATLSRVREIGTFRAIGAGHSFVWSILVVEALLVGLVFGGLGAAAGAAFVDLMGTAGIPAQSDIWKFVFSGSKLYPTVGWNHIGLSLVIVLVVSTISSLYPAWLATRVTPRHAMATAE